MSNPKRNTSRARLETDLVSVTRLLNSASGNPRWRLLTKHGSYDTRPDSQCNYDVKDTLEVTYPQRVALGFDDERGRVTHIEYLEDGGTR